MTVIGQTSACKAGLTNSDDFLFLIVQQLRILSNRCSILIQIDAPQRKLHLKTTCAVYSVALRGYLTFCAVAVAHHSRAVH